MLSSVRRGAPKRNNIHVMMGSTFKMGAGMNVQDRLVALHDLDCPWRPGDLEQRKGRIVRQGNKNKKVHIYRYVTEGTFDSYLWQTVEMYWLIQLIMIILLLSKMLNLITVIQ